MSKDRPIWFISFVVCTTNAGRPEQIAPPSKIHKITKVFIVVTLAHKLSMITAVLAILKYITPDLG